MRRAIVALLAAAAAACAAAAVVLYVRSLGTIPVVRTWGDLLGSPAIDLGGGVTARLGIEATVCPQWSGVMLYCLAEGYQPPGEWPALGERLGPVRVRVHNEQGSEATVEREGWALRRQDPGLSRRRLLYALPLTSSRTGAFRIEVLAEDGAVIGTGALRATANPLPPWIPLGDWRHQEAGSDRRCIAVPGCDPAEPLIVDDPESSQLAADDVLPTLLPSAPDPGFRIARSEEGIEVTAEGGLLETNPWYAFLARWWVNGEPFIAAQQGGYSKAGGGHRLADKSLRIPLELDPALSARPGDRIGLEILYCPTEWDLVSDGVSRLVRVYRTNLGLLPRLSNRIEFTVP